MEKQEILKLKKAYHMKSTTHTAIHTGGNEHVKTSSIVNKFLFEIYAQLNISIRWTKPPFESRYLFLTTHTEQQYSKCITSFKNTNVYPVKWHRSIFFFFDIKLTFDEACCWPWNLHWEMHRWRLGGLGRSWEMHGGINGIERGGSLAISVVPKQYVKAKSRPIKTKSKKSFEVEKHCPWPVGAKFWPVPY